ncbi:MAG: hypothetical protein ACKVP4_13295 [Hyphomicrobium sp.]
MIDPKSLKNVLHRDATRLSKLLIVLAAVDKPADVTTIRQLAKDAGLNTKDWNISDILASSKGKAIRSFQGWELTDSGHDEVAKLLGGAVKRVQPAASALRAEMTSITDPVTLDFVDEAVRCYEAGLLRSAIVMSWLAAVDVLYIQVLAQKLAEFNAAALKQNAKWKDATDRDGLALMKEVEFLERAFSIRVITKNERAALEECLTRRNTCGHPNSFKIGPSTVEHHIDLLIRNVFSKFAASARTAKT